MPAQKPSLSDRMHQFRIFIQIADMASFVGAARALKIPPATVSAAIRKLEGELGVRLLHRTTRQVNLTHDGQRILPMARQITSALDDLYLALKNDEHAMSGPLNVCMPSRIASRMLAPQLPALLQQHPALELIVRQHPALEFNLGGGNGEQHLDLAREGIDCAIQLGDAQHECLIRKPLGEVDMIHCASPAYLAVSGVPLHPDDLGQHWAVGHLPSAHPHPAIWRFTHASGAPPRTITMRHRIVVNNVDSYVACCLAGLGLIQVPRFDVCHLLASGELVEVLPDWPAPSMPVVALYLHRNQRSHRLATFLDWFQAVLNRTLM